MAKFVYASIDVYGETQARIARGEIKESVAQAAAYEKKVDACDELAVKVMQSGGFNHNVSLGFKNDTITNKLLKQANFLYINHIVDYNFAIENAVTHEDYSKADEVKQKYIDERINLLTREHPEHAGLELKKKVIEEFVCIGALEHDLGTVLEFSPNGNGHSATGQQIGASEQRDDTQYHSKVDNRYNDLGRISVNNPFSRTGNEETFSTRADQAYSPAASQQSPLEKLQATQNRLAQIIRDENALSDKPISMNNFVPISPWGLQRAEELGARPVKVNVPALAS